LKPCGEPDFDALCCAAIGRRACSGVILKAIGASSQDSLISIKPGHTSLKRGDDPL
jgi:hypothetical protein